MKGLLARKPIEQLMRETDSDESPPMKRVLGPLNLVSLGVGVIIGAGIFVLTGQAAALYAGPAIIVSFMLSALACALAGLCYAEFASMIPIAGSAYTYAYATLGEFFAWIIGWDLVLEYLFGASAVAVGWSGYMISFLNDYGLHIPPQLTGAAGIRLVHLDTGWAEITPALLQQMAEKGIDSTTLPQVTTWFNLPAILIVAALTWLLVFGIRESAHFNNFIVIVKLTVILLFIGLGLSFVKTSNWTPFLPANTGEFGHFGWSGVLRAAGVIFFAYIGFDCVSTTAQEARNPQRDMPIGIIGSLLVSTVLYIFVALVITGIVKYTQLAVPDPIAVAVNAAGPGLKWLRPFIKIGAIAGLSSVILVLLMGQPRIFFAMARDGLLPACFGKIHSRFRTPHIPTILTGAIAMVVAGLFPIRILGEMVSIGTLLAFLIVCIGVLILRYRHPEIRRVFRVPGVPFVPVLGAAIAGLEMISLPADTWIRLVVWMLVGFCIYWVFGRRHSRLRQQLAETEIDQPHPVH